MSIILSVLPIIIALALGMLLGKYLPKAITQLINPLVSLLLLLIGYQFGEVLLSEDTSLGKTLGYALMFSLSTSVACFIAIYCWRWQHHQQQRQLKKRLNSLVPLLHSLKECGMALGIVGLGIVFFLISQRYAVSIDSRMIDGLLYALIFVVGVDMAAIKLRAVFTQKTLLLPISVVLASWAGGTLSALILGESLFLSLALSSGFGWFTLSGVMVANEVSPWYGSVALLTDLFREFWAIILLYGLSERYSYESVGVGGATALDSTLPMIKRNYPSKMIPVAILSGLILTLLAPVFISVFLTLYAQ